MITQLPVEKYMELNAKLQQKKNALRKSLKEKGVLKKDKTNNFDNYQYFSEAGYKELFTELFSKHNLELTTNEIGYEAFEGKNEKMPNGRKVTFEFKLHDCETGFYEQSVISGEGLDKGDKAGYKADTGALKYYLANTFMVATGDDAESESPESKGAPKSKSNNNVKATQKQVELIAKLYEGEQLNRMLSYYNVASINELSVKQASEAIAVAKKGAENGTN